MLERRQEAKRVYGSKKLNYITVQKETQVGKPALILIQSNIPIRTWPPIKIYQEVQEQRIISTADAVVIARINTKARHPSLIDSIAHGTPGDQSTTSPATGLIRNLHLV